MDYAKESLRLHGEWKGKIEVVTRVPVENKDDLSLAYTPGVAQPCLEIQKFLDLEISDRKPECRLWKENVSFSRHLVMWMHSRSALKATMWMRS